MGGRQWIRMGMAFVSPTEETVAEGTPGRPAVCHPCVSGIDRLEKK